MHNIDSGIGKRLILFVFDFKFNRMIVCLTGCSLFDKVKFSHNIPLESLFLSFLLCERYPLLETEIVCGFEVVISAVIL